MTRDTWDGNDEQPYLNRFTQPDTVTSGGPQGLNRYSYTGDSLLNAIDIFGYCAFYMGLMDYIPRFYDPYLNWTSGPFDK